MLFKRFKLEVKCKEVALLYCTVSINEMTRFQHLVKQEKFCFRYLDFYFRHGESTSIAYKLNSTASQKSQDINKAFFLLQNLDFIINLNFIKCLAFWQSGI